MFIPRNIKLGSNSFFRHNQQRLLPLFNFVFPVCADWATLYMYEYNCFLYSCSNRRVFGKWYFLVYSLKTGVLNIPTSVRMTPCPQTLQFKLCGQGIILNWDVTDTCLCRMNNFSQALIFSNIKALSSLSRCSLAKYQNIPGNERPS